VVPVAVIGAGPYGLSIGAHLRARGVAFRIFGQAMETWRFNMPKGMLLKSEGFASNLHDPERESTLARFCAREGVPYGDTGVPVPLETLASYGLSFQRRHVPDLEEQRVESLERSSQGFRLRLADGTHAAARRVVLAVGGGYFSYVPDELAHLPSELLSHSGEHHDLGRFAGQDVTVIGAGASALDLVALLQGVAREVRLAARRPALHFHTKDGTRTLWHKVRYPLAGIGPGWRNCFFADTPWLFRYLPQATRVRTVRTHLGPAGPWWLKDQIVGRVPLLLGCAAVRAEPARGGVRLQLTDGAGVQRDVLTDHVIAATGYRVDVRRLSFVSEDIRGALRSLEGAPALSGAFESSVPGLYFAGLASAFDFGPVMRFMCGAGHPARRISSHLARAAA
jgi:hypothetical protein